MLRFWRMLMAIFSKSDRKQIHLLLLSAAVLGLIEVAGVASVMPFLAVVLNPEVVQSNRYLQAVYQYFGFADITQFQIFLGVASLAILVFSNAFSAFVAWATFRFCYLRTSELCVRLLDVYLRQQYASVMQRSRAELEKILVTDIDRVLIGTLMAGITLFADLVAAVFILVILFLVDPLVSSATFLVLGLSYGALWMTISRPVSILGEEFPALGTAIVGRTQEAIDALKEIKVAGREQEFVRRLSIPRLTLARNAIRHSSLELLPSRVIETTAFGVIIVVTLYLLTSTGNPGSAMAMVGFYTFAAYRLVPKMKSIFEGVDAVRYNAPALKIICEDFKSGADKATQPARADEAPLVSGISLHDVTFTYPGNQSPAVQHLSLTIPARLFTCIAGPTGAGKSTAVDILLGLHQPEAGHVLLDDARLERDTPLPSRCSVGYVPQMIHLLDDTVASNIAFGLDPGQIDHQRVRKAAEQAQIHEFIESGLAKGYDTMVGEGGMRLSGGQRQRIGLARALYEDPQVLILDEATNGLDARIESELLDCLLALQPAKTIVCISHRSSVAARADQVLILEKGRLVAQGRYEELSADHSPVRRLLLAK